MSDEAAPADKNLIEFDLGENGGEVELRDVEEVRGWISDEQTLWNWLDGVEGNSGKNIHDRFDPVFEKLTNMAAEIDKAGSEEAKALAVKQFVGHLKKQYNPDNPAILHSGGDVAKRIEVVRDREGDEVAAQVVAYQVGTPCTKNPPRDWMPGAFEQIAYDRGIDSSIHEKKRLDELKHEFTGTLKDCKTTANDDHELALKQLRDVSKTLEALDLKYREKIKFKEPVTYWNKKKEDHDVAAKFWGFASVGVLAAGLVAVSAYWFFSPSPADTLKTLEESYSEVPASVIVGTALHSSIRFALFMLGIIWLGRIVVRNYLSHTHLATDAAERAVVIQTYLSLIADPEVVENKEHHDKMLEHALKRIFWHAQTGIVKDDAMPDVAWIPAAGKS